MSKFIFLFLFVCVSCSIRAQQQIVYDLPENVTKKVREHIGSSEGKKYVILLSTMDSAKYRITIMGDVAGNPNFKDIDETLVQKTNRFVRVDKTLIPIITWEDIKFADFGTVHTPDSKSEKRRVGKKKIHFITDDPGITFDNSGRIY